MNNNIIYVSFKKLAKATPVKLPIVNKNTKTCSS